MATENRADREVVVAWLRRKIPGLPLDAPTARWVLEPKGLSYSIGPPNGSPALPPTALGFSREPE